MHQVPQGLFGCLWVLRVHWQLRGSFDSGTDLLVKGLRQAQGGLAFGMLLMVLQRVICTLHVCNLQHRGRAVSQMG